MAFPYDPYPWLSGTPGAAPPWEQQPAGPPPIVASTDPDVIDYGSAQDAQVGEAPLSPAAQAELAKNDLINTATPGPSQVEHTGVDEAMRIARSYWNPGFDTGAPDSVSDRPRTDVARIAQSPGPIGTVQQIGDPGLEASLRAAASDTPPYAQSPEPPPTAKLPWETADAVSGVDQPPPDGAFVGAAPMPMERPIEEIQDPVAQANAWAELAKKDPEAYANAMRTHAIDEQRRHLEGEEKIVRQDWERAKKIRENTEQAFARAQKMQQQIETDSAALAKQKIDPHRGWSNKSTAQKIAGVMAAIFGGFAQNFHGGPNVGLETINREIDRDIDAQKQDIANAGADLNRRQGLVAQLYAQTGDLERSAETARRAAKEQSLQELEMKMLEYNPNGSMARQFAQQIIQGRAQLASENQKWAEHQIDRDIKAGEYGIKVAELKLKQNADQRAAAKAAGAGKGVKQSPDYWEAYSRGQRPPHDMTQKEFNEWLGTAGKVKALNKPDTEKSPAQLRKEEAEAGKSEAEAAAAKHGFEIASPETGEALINKDGTPFVVLNVDEQKRVRGITTAALNIRRLADKIEEVRKKTGGGSKLMGSDDAQELTSLAKAVDFETYKAFDLGAPSAGDKEMAEGVRGGVDITSFLKDPKKGLQTYADSVEKKALAHLRGAGYTGEAIKFHRAGDLKKTAPSVIEQFASEIEGAKYEPNTGPLEKLPGQFTTGFNQADENRHIEERIDQLAAYAEQSGDQGDLARKTLKQLSVKAVSPAARDRIKKILEGAPGANPRGDEAR